MSNERFWGISEAERELPRRRAETARLNQFTTASVSTYSAMVCLPPDLSAQVRKQRDDALRAVADDAL